MSLHIHQTNQLDYLYPIVAKNIRSESSRTPHTPLRFIVSGFAMEQRLRQRIAEINGIFAHADFKFPRQFSIDLATQFALQPSVSFSRDALLLHLYQLLQSNLAQRALTPELRSYIQHDNIALANRRRLDLAQSLAENFDQYQWQRQDWLKQWRQQRDVAGLPTELQQMQKKLWQLLLQNNNEADHAQNFQQLLKQLQTTKASSKIKSYANSVHIFGLSPMQLNIVHLAVALAQHIEVYFYHFNPSAELWFEQLHSPIVENQLFFAQSEHHTENNFENSLSKITATASTTLDIAHLFNQHHPLLMSLGQQQAGFERLFMEFDADVYYHPQQKTPKNLLQQCQQQLFANLNEATIKAQLQSLPIDANDDSLVIHQADHAQSELYHLRQAIITWLDANPDAHLSDVLVVAPDIAEYASWIPCIFADTPHKIAHLSEHPKQFRQRFQQLLQLLASDLALTQLQQFVHANSANTDLLHWQALLPRLQSLGYRKQQNHPANQHRQLQECITLLWQQQLSNPSESIDWQTMTQRLNELQQLKNFWQSAQTQQPLTNWLDYLRQLILWLSQHRLITNNTDETRRLLHRLDEWQQLISARSFNSPIDFQQLLQLWQYREVEPAATVQFFDGNLSFANLLAMRCLTHRFIAIIGFNSRFAASNTPNAFDLCAYQSRTGDRNTAQDQRQQFLEYLCHAQDKLWISFIADGTEVVSPSPVLLTLQNLYYLKITPLADLSRHANDTLWQLGINKPLDTTISVLPPLAQPKTKLANYISIKQLGDQLCYPLKHYLRSQHVQHPQDLPETLANVYTEKFDGLLSWQIKAQVFQARFNGDEETLKQLKEPAKLTVNKRNNFLLQQQWQVAIEQEIVAADKVFTALQKKIAKLTDIVQAANQSKQQLRQTVITTEGDQICLYAQLGTQHWQQSEQLWQLSYRQSLKDMLQGWLLHLLTGKQIYLIGMKLSNNRPLELLRLPTLRNASERSEKISQLLDYSLELQQCPNLINPAIIETYIKNKDWTQTISNDPIYARLLPLAGADMANNIEQTITRDINITTNAFSPHNERFNHFQARKEINCSCRCHTVAVKPSCCSRCKCCASFSQISTCSRAARLRLISILL